MTQTSRTHHFGLGLMAEIKRGDTVQIQSAMDAAEKFPGKVLLIDSAGIIVRPDNSNLIMSFDLDTKVSIAGGYFLDES